MTHYATVFQEDPHGVITSGLRFWKAPYSVDPEFAEIVWDVVWDVVTTYPQTGVKKAVPSIAEPKQKIAVGVYFNEGARYCPSGASIRRPPEAHRPAGQGLHELPEVDRALEPVLTRLGHNALKYGGVFMVVWMPAAGDDRPGHSDPSWSCKASLAGGTMTTSMICRRREGWGKPVMIRLAHEMNGSWYPYGTAFDSPGLRHTATRPPTTFRCGGTFGISFRRPEPRTPTGSGRPISCLSMPTTPWPSSRPTIRLVSGRWLCRLDRPGRLLQRREVEVEDLFRIVRRLVSGHHGHQQKPLMIAEFGCSEAGARRNSKADWIKQTYMVDIPRVTRESSW